jgi:hypothetical protein
VASSIEAPVSDGLPVGKYSQDCTFMSGVEDLDTADVRPWRPASVTPVSAGSVDMPIARTRAGMNEARRGRWKGFPGVLMSEQTFGVGVVLLTRGAASKAGIVPTAGTSNTCLGSSILQSSDRTVIGNARLDVRPRHLGGLDVRKHSGHTAVAERQVPQSHPTLDDYDRLARVWREEIVLPRRHRNSGQIIGEVREQERSALIPLPTDFLSESRLAAWPSHLG